MTPPTGLQEVLEFYGNPMPLIDEDTGRVSNIWETNLVRVAFPSPLPLGWTVGPELETKFARSATVHKKLESNLTTVFVTLREEDLWRYLRTYDGGYVWRTQRGSTSTLSMHSFGAALDFDAKTNPLGRRHGDMNRDVVRVFELHGWTWGGRFKRPDSMHFQFARGV